MRLEDLDTVRIARLHTQERYFEGCEGTTRAPRLGDEGTVVRAAAKGDASATVMVECCDADGGTIWLAEFASDELELTDASLLAKRHRAVRRARGWALGGALGFAACTIGLLSANPRGHAPSWPFPGLLLGLTLVLLGTDDLDRALGATQGFTRMQRVLCFLLRVPLVLVGLGGVASAAMSIYLYLLASERFDSTETVVFLSCVGFLGISGICVLIQPFRASKK